MARAGSQATRDRSAAKCEGGKIIRVEAHPIPEHPRPRRCKGRVALVGDAAGYVTKCSGEGIYFAAKSGRMAAEAIVEGSQSGKYMVEEADLRTYLDKWDKKYWATYKACNPAGCMHPPLAACSSCKPPAPCLQGATQPDAPQPAAA